MDSARSAIKESPKQHINILSNFLLVTGAISIVTVIILGWHSYRLLKIFQNKRNPAIVNTSVSQVVKNDALTGFITDLSNSSVDIKNLYKQGPAKDSIPSINNPIFVNATDANLAQSEEGILINISGEQRFYPYSILVWHNIVNDVVGQNDQSKYIVVSYCPVTGNSAAFNRFVKNETVEFGVSGLLYESNLVMYDRKTESLWSQSLGKGIVGEYNNSALERFDTQSMTFADAMALYPNVKVLSSDTGFVRDYRYNPYAEYQKSDILYPEFKLSFKDERYPAKKLFYIVEQNNKSVAIDTLSMTNDTEYSFVKNGVNLKAKKIGSEITVVDGKCKLNCENAKLAGYYEMWFSWAVQHQKDGEIYDISSI